MELMEAQVERWGKREGGRVSTQDLNGSRNEEDGDEAELWNSDVGMRVYGDED